MRSLKQSVDKDKRTRVAPISVRVINDISVYSFFIRAK